MSTRNEIRRAEDGMLWLWRVTPGPEGDYAEGVGEVTVEGVTETIQQVADKQRTAEVQAAHFAGQVDAWQGVLALLATFLEAESENP
jgi:hypothetical protein